MDLYQLSAQIRTLTEHVLDFFNEKVEGEKLPSIFSYVKKEKKKANRQKEGLWITFNYVKI